jgi:hypothetical protein
MSIACSRSWCTRLMGLSESSVCAASFLAEEATMTESSRGSWSWLSVFRGSGAMAGEEMCSRSIRGPCTPRVEGGPA